MRRGIYSFEVAPERLQRRHFATRAVASDELAEATERNLDPRLILRRCCEGVLGDVADSARSSLDEAGELLEPLPILFVC